MDHRLPSSSSLPRGSVRRSMRWPAALAALALVLAGCDSGASDDPAPTGEPSTPTETGDVPGGSPDAGAPVDPDGIIPATRAGEAAIWVLEALAREEGPDAAEASERFGEEFLAEIPAEQVAMVFDQLRAYGPFRVDGHDGLEDAAEITLLGTDSEDRFLLYVTTDPGGQIIGLFLQPAPQVPELESLDDLPGLIESAAEETSVLVAEVEAGVCEPLVAGSADELRPIGSIFKVYVLEAVRQQIDAGELEWDTVLVLTDDLRSLPSGTLQEEPAGTEVTVREAAEAMIAISDNTATDLLIDVVGREQVEQAVVALGHGEPETLQPFLTTREMFQLAFTDGELRQSWQDASDAAQRREILDGLPGGEIVLDEQLATQAAWPIGLDWFATAEDLCEAFAGIHDPEAPEAQAVIEIMALNPGIQSVEAWEHVGFKGGSSVGEIAGTWYLESADGDSYVVVTQFAGADAMSVPDVGWMVGVVDQVAGLLE